MTCAALAALAVAPGAAAAHDGTNDGRYDGRHDNSRYDGERHGHHKRVVVLKGTVAGVNTEDGTLSVQVADANRKGRGLVGDTVTVKAVKGWVADTNNDGKRSLADIQTGDKVIVFTKRRFVDEDAKTVSAAFVIDKTRPKTADKSAYRDAYKDGARDGDCDRKD